MNSDYWHQRAAPWVSASVLVGGMVTSILLFMLVRFQNKVEASYLGENLPTASRAYLQE
jgi:hypothetical protein